MLACVGAEAGGGGERGDGLLFSTSSTGMDDFFVDVDESPDLAVNLERAAMIVTLLIS